jgi:hypothetical protein
MTPKRTVVCKSYLRNMMDVMLFDAGRRGQVISQAELADIPTNWQWP